MYMVYNIRTEVLWNYFRDYAHTWVKEKFPFHPQVNSAEPSPTGLGVCEVEESSHQGLSTNSYSEVKLNDECLLNVHARL